MVDLDISGIIMHITIKVGIFSFYNIKNDMREIFMLEVILDRKTYSKFLDYAINNCDAFSCVLEKDEHNKSKYIFQELYYCILDLIVDKKILDTIQIQIQNFLIVIT